MLARSVVQGQMVAESKTIRSRQFRREMTAAERLLRHELRGDKLHGLHVRRQQIIDGFIVDFSCHAAGLVVEVDGPDHDDRQEYDAGRDRVRAARDLGVLRIPDSAVARDLPAVRKQIATALESSKRAGDASAAAVRSGIPFPAREGCRGVGQP